MFYGVLKMKVLGDSTFLHVTVDEVVAGYEEYVPLDTTVVLRYATEDFMLPFAARGSDAPDGAELFGGLETGERYLFKAYFDTGYRFFYQDPSYVKDKLVLTPLDKNLWYLPAEGLDLDAAEYSGLKADIDLLRQNLSAVQVVSTKDMSAMPDMQESLRTYYLTDGRWLDYNDHTSESRVCVINSSLALRRGLAVGDTITLTLRDYQSGVFGYIPSYMRDSLEDIPSVTEELEIVGLYDNFARREFNQTMDSLVVYIPDSVMPAGYGAASPVRLSPLKAEYPEIDSRFLSENPSDWTMDGLEPSPLTELDIICGEVMNPATYSFTLKSVHDKEAFLQEYTEPLTALGYSVVFSINNADNFWSSVAPVMWSAKVNAAVFSGLLILALLLAVFLFLQWHRREFAIMRALGVPSKNASRQLLITLLTVGGTSVLAGSIPAWRYSEQKSSEMLASILEITGGEAADAPCLPAKDIRLTAVPIRPKDKPPLFAPQARFVLRH